MRLLILKTANFRQLNIVIISDHGMTGTGPSTNVTYLDLKDYVELNDVIKILDYGASAVIAPLPRNTEKVVYDEESIAVFLPFSNYGLILFSGIF
jgi:hypothetical protein